MVLDLDLENHVLLMKFVARLEDYVHKELLLFWVQNLKDTLVTVIAIEDNHRKVKGELDLQNKSRPRVVDRE